nr:MAG TPA_asm: hypothetical protein [Caudoviricetes sp.]
MHPSLSLCFHLGNIISHSRRVDKLETENN